MAPGQCQSGEAQTTPGQLPAGPDPRGPSIDVEGASQHLPRQKLRRSARGSCSECICSHSVSRRGAHSPRGNVRFYFLAFHPGLCAGLARMCDSASRWEQPDTPPLHAAVILVACAVALEDVGSGEAFRTDLWSRRVSRHRRTVDGGRRETRIADESLSESVGRNVSLVPSANKRTAEIRHCGFDYLEVLGTRVPAWSRMMGDGRHGQRLLGQPVTDSAAERGWIGGHRTQTISTLIQGLRLGVAVGGRPPSSRTVWRVLGRGRQPCGRRG